jgi:CelD/BcsL family acetyltransferase involved in cellulose biosynthesis
LQSPFFHPDYTREAAAVFGNVEVAILDEGDEPVAYFPFQRTRHNVGMPVGGLLCDIQGLICRPGFTCNAASLMRKCRLSGYRYTQLLASQSAFEQYHWLKDDSRSMDLRDGFDAFCRERREAGSTFVSRIRDKTKKAVKALGPLRFEFDSTDPAALDSLVEWKSQQYDRIRSVNHLLKPGTLDFLKRLLARQGDDFHGVLSAMYLGDQLVAVHLGMRCRDVLHLWFPTYNEEFGKHSPGLIYFVEQARAAADMGIHRLDMGRGNDKFKTSMCSLGTPVAEGAVGLGLLSTSVRRTWLYARKWAESSRFREPARTAVRTIRGLFLHGAGNESSSR